MGRGNNFVTVSGITMGGDTVSALAYWITVDGVRLTVPYSVTKARHLTHNKGADSIEIEQWFADKEELEYDD